jgi:hypothetical protein
MREADPEDDGREGGGQDDGPTQQQGSLVPVVEQRGDDERAEDLAYGVPGGQQRHRAGEPQVVAHGEGEAADSDERCAEEDRRDERRRDPADQGGQRDADGLHRQRGEQKIGAGPSPAQPRP